MFYGSLSNKGFRKYLVAKLVQQAKLGVSQIHLGETNGKLGFESSTIYSFVNWLNNKYTSKNLSWWVENFDEFGEKIYNKNLITIEDVKKLAKNNKEKFYSEWGEIDDWKGLNQKREKAFLYKEYFTM